MSRQGASPSDEQRGARPRIVSGGAHFRPQFEPLEVRELLSATPWPQALPAISPDQSATIQAELFDLGGAGVAYRDIDPRSDGLFFRLYDQADFNTFTNPDGGEGIGISSFQPSEWMGYTIDVAEHGAFDIVARVSSPAALGTNGGLLHIEFGPVGQIGPGGGPGEIQSSPLIVVPGTGGSTNFTEVVIRGIHLDEGSQWMRLVSDAGNVGIDWIEFRPAGHVHVGNSSAATEHAELLDLVPAAEATHVAVQSGDWSNPATWAFGILPTSASQVWIPEGIQVRYNQSGPVAESTRIRWIRVDGTMSYATDVSTLLKVDTIVVTAAGKYEQGTAIQSIDRNVTSTVIFTDDGAIDRNWDPTELSRGLISHGDASIFGAQKTTSVETLQHPRIGNTSITLLSAPSGWRVGDEIVISGTRIRDLNTGTAIPTADTSYVPQISTEDEVRRITSINGTTVTFAEPLVYDHVPPSGITDAIGRTLHVWVANLTRNVLYRSENTSYANNAQMHRHGHVMFMHSDKVTVNYAQFKDLGRTNKALQIDDVKVEISANRDNRFTEGTGTNVRGRYGLHFHLTGVNGNGSPVTAQGNSLSGGPGWGYVNHGSYVAFEDNVAYDVPGAAFVEEDGRGIGYFNRNIAIKSVGTGRQETFSEDGLLRDLGFSGHGYFFRGNAVDASDSIAISAASSGFAWSNRGDTRVEVNNLEVPTNSLHHPEIALGGDTIAWEAVPTKFFRHNTVIASGAGIEASFWMAPHTQAHDGRTEVRDFTAYNLIGPVGAFVQYTRSLTYTNVKIYRDPTLTDQGVFGIRSDTNVTQDHVYDNVHVSGYRYGLRTQPTANGFHQTFVVLDSSNFSTGNTQAYYDTQNFTFVQKSSLNTNVLTFTGVSEAVPAESRIRVGMYVSGTKTDSLGTEAIEGRGGASPRFYVGPEQIEDLLARGYYSDTAGTFLMIPILITDRVSLKTATFYVRATVDPNAYPTIPIGPNLGKWRAGGIIATQVNAGGPAAGGFSADSDFTGGSVITTTASIRLPLFGYISPSIYRSARVGRSQYNVDNLTPGAIYTVRLHFAEIEKTATGQRRFDVAINDKTVLREFDIVAAAGQAYKGVVRDYTARANANGVIRIDLIAGSTGNPLISGIEILKNLASLVAEPVVASVPAGSYSEHQRVSLVSSTPDAVIYYTTDGSAPTTSSAVFHHPIDITQTTTIRAISVAPGMSNSEIVSLVYSINPASRPYQINLGGTDTLGYSADLYTVGLIQSVVHTRPVDTSHIFSAPMSIYQSSLTLRFGTDFWTILPNLDPSGTYTLRLHFTEPEFQNVGDRRFDFWLNGEQIFDEYDVLAQAGGKDRAYAVNLNVQPDASGRLFLYFESGTTGALSNAPIISGIEVFTQGP